MEKTKIPYCESTWNPISGCYHSCPYCYARSFATRFAGCDASPGGQADTELIVLKERMKATTKDGKEINAAYPYGFTPTLHEYRLNDPLTKNFGKTIFVCSMADMFGRWIPDEWIEKVFSVCEKANDHRYLFLTKNPARYLELAKKGLLPERDNFWYGSTVTNAGMYAFFSDRHHTFISVEPILGILLVSEALLLCGVKDKGVASVHGHNCFIHADTLLFKYFNYAAWV